MPSKSVLNIWSTAGIGAILSHGLKRFGYKSKCIVRDGYDRFGISEYYGAESIEGPNDFKNRCLSQAGKYDIIHIHSLPEYVPLIASKYPSKKIILHYHGSDLSNCDNRAMQKAQSRRASKILVSTPDLLEIERKAIHLPNPIDTELFTNTNTEQGALFILYKHLIPEKARAIASKHGIIKYDTINRDSKITNYKDMPRLLNGYGLYLDIKPSTWMPVKDSLSTTGLQALACGLQVLTPSGFKIGFPKEHSIKRVTEQLIKIYESI